MFSKKCHGIYLHIPFCITKCDYCSFFSVFPTEEKVRLFVQTVEKQFKYYKEFIVKQPIETVFIGGGNPTCIGIKSFEEIVNCILKLLPNPPLEWTIESNPETLSKEIASILRNIPNLRVSLGVQRLDDCELSAIGRRGNRKTIFEALETALGLTKNVGIDIIIGIPGFKDISSQLEEILEQFPLRHVSAYFLTLEPNTKLEKRVRAGEFPDPDDANVDELFTVKSLLEGKNFEHYEISNFAARGFRCRHNLNYWLGYDYLGIGPSSVSTINGRRIFEPSDFDDWICNRNKLEELLSMEILKKETIMLRLRLLQDGLSLEELKSTFGEPSSSFYSIIESEIKTGRLSLNEGRLKLTAIGIPFANDVISKLF